MKCLAKIVAYTFFLLFVSVVASANKFKPVAETDSLSLEQRAKLQRNTKLREIIKSELYTQRVSGTLLGKLSTAQSFATVGGCYMLLGEYTTALDYYAKYLPLIREAICEEFILEGPKEREITWKKEFDRMNEICNLIDYIEPDTEQYAKLSSLIYDVQLLTKGILLSSNIEFDKLLKRYGTQDMLEKYNTIRTNLAQIDSLRQNRQVGENLLALTRETENLQLSLSRECTQFGNFTDYLKYNAEDVKQSLPDDAVSVEFATIGEDIVFADEKNIVAILLSNDFPLGKIIQIAKVGEIRQLIADKDKFSNDYYGKLIWSKILQATNGKATIYFSPDGLLNNVGIEYLQLNGRPISEQVNLNRVSSTKELCRAHEQKTLKYIALFGDVDYTDDGSDNEPFEADFTYTNENLIFSNLDNTKREIIDIQQILKKGYKKAKISPFTGTNSSKSNFFATAGNNVNLLHIATHGKYIADNNSSDDESMTHCILAFAGANLYGSWSHNAGIVNAAEIATMTLQDCNLVVLSACESGIGKLGDDGVFGLQRGFKNAGVKTLLVSLNEVADEASASMMIAFYKYYMSGNGITQKEALGMAQKDIRQQYTNDNTWASFILIDSFN